MGSWKRRIWPTCRRDIDLVTNSGGIGADDNDLEINGAGTGQRNNSLEIGIDAPEVGRLYAVADDSIYIKEVNAALNVQHVASNAGDVRLSVLDTAFLNAEFDGPYAEDLIVLPTAGSTLTGTPLPAGSVTALSGSVTFDVGDDVYVPVGARVEAAAEINIFGDIDGSYEDNGNIDEELSNVLAVIQGPMPFATGRGPEKDPNTGTAIELQGDLIAPTLRAIGGADMDFIQLLGTTGVNPDGSTYLIGTSADDRFFVQSVFGETTVQGGSGADRYYVSSNASKARFSQRGFFDLEETYEDSDPFDLLDGTLQYITQPLNIETGAGGNGGTRDVIRISAGGNSTPVHGVIDNGAVTGLGMPSGGQVDYFVPDGESAFVMVGLSGLDDTFQVERVENNVIAQIQGRDGDDTLTIGNQQAPGPLADIFGIVTFLGEDGSSDELNVYGDATADRDSATGVDPDQLSAISITGLGMGLNQLVSTHNFYGAGYDLDDDTYPAAIYFAKRSTLDGVDTISSSVEHVNLQLGAGDDTLNVDSVSSYGTTVVRAGAGNDLLTVGSTPTGLYPNSSERVDFVHGDLQLFGEADSNTIIVNDSGEDDANVGTYQGATVSGLDMSGSITFDSADVIRIQLGGQADTFYIPGTRADLTTTLQTGDGFDTVYVGTVAGEERTGTLDNLLGPLVIEGGQPEAQDTLYLNDQASTTSQTYQVRNEQTSTRTLLDGRMWPVDTTTVSRGGAADIQYRSLETVVLNAGQASDTVNLYATHREQSTEGGLNSTFTVNGGLGNDVVNLGEPDPARGNDFSLDRFAIQPGTPDSTRGIPVVVNGQDGNDTVHFLDNATSLDTELAFAENSFSELFPEGSGQNSISFKDVFEQIFGEDPTTTSYATVALQRAGQDDPEPLNINARTVETIEVSLGSGEDIIQLTSGQYNYGVVVNAGDGDDVLNVESGVDFRENSATVNGEAGDDLVFVDFEAGVPEEAVNLIFNGGANSLTVGDKFRIAGDGVTTGGEYRPDSATSQTGRLTIGGNAFRFTGVEPLVVHGLPDLRIITPDDPADLQLDSLRVADLELPNLVLKVVTVDGVVSWTPQDKLEITDALEPKNVGKAMSMSGNTLAVAADLDGASYGVVYIYEWIGANWQETAKLYANDRGSAGQGFGESLALVGDTLLVGAPGDDTRGLDAGAVYVFQRSAGAWTQTDKLLPRDGEEEEAFGTSVAFDGTYAAVGAGDGNE